MKQAMVARGADVCGEGLGLAVADWNVSAATTAEIRESVVTLDALGPHDALARAIADVAATMENGDRADQGHLPDTVRTALTARRNAPNVYSVSESCCCCDM